MFFIPNFWHTILIRSLFVRKACMNFDKKPKVIKLNLEFDEKNLSIEDRIILDHLSLITHVAEA